MTVYGGYEGGDEVFVSRDPETAAETREFEDLNVLRIAGLALLYGDGEVARDIADELGQLGFAHDLAAGTRSFDPRWSPMPTRAEASERHRTDHWVALNAGGSGADANAFLVAALASPLERESTMAAAVLHRIAEARRPFRSRLAAAVGDLRRSEAGRSHPGKGTTWSGDTWLEEVAASGARDTAPAGAVVFELGGRRLAAALHSRDTVTRGIAQAALIGPSFGAFLRPRPRPVATEVETAVSTMVHGTWAFVGDWWPPGGAFYEYAASFRGDLWDGVGVPFDWSGSLRDRDRAHAAKKLRRWAAAEARDGLHTVFAHSYGAEVTARAMTSGIRVDELVMLSAPVTRHVIEGAARARRVIDVRLPLDPVLSAAQGFGALFGRKVRQKMPPAPNLTPVRLGWSVRHGASHEEQVWRDQQVRERAGL